MLNPTGLAVALLGAGLLTYLTVTILGSMLRGSPLILKLGSVLTFIASLLTFTASIIFGLGFVRAYPTAIRLNPLNHYPILIDPLSVVLLLVISLVSMATALYTPKYMEEYARLGRPGLFASLMSLFIMSMILIVISGNILWFLFTWEVMTFASYLLIVWEYDEEYVIKAGWKYFTSMHFLSTLPLLVAVILTVAWGGSASIAMLKHTLTGLGLPALITLYSLYLIGFAAKAGVVPFHFWLPDAHPAAPSNVSALLSGVMIKVAVYGMLRFCCFMLPMNAAVGYVVATLGVLSLIVGNLYALKQTDAKRLLAYSSIGQIGYIWLGLGAGVILLVNGNPLGVVGIVAGLYHLINHATFKGLLFLSAGSILYKTRTRNLSVLGGLARVMPATSILTLIAALSITGIPPFNGFLSKWLIYESTFSSMNWLLIIYGIMALFMSAATLAYSLRLYSSAFMGDLRTEVKGGDVPTSMLAGMTLLAAFCVLWGVLPVTAVPLLSSVSLTLYPSEAVRALTTTILWVNISISSFSPTLLLLFLGVVFSVTLALSTRFRAHHVLPWDTGAGLSTDRVHYRLIAAHYYRGFEEAIHGLYRAGGMLCERAYAGVVAVVNTLVAIDVRVSEALARLADSCVKTVARLVDRAREVYFDELIISPVASVLKELGRVLGWSVLRTDLNTYLIYSAIYVIVLSIAVIVFTAGLMVP